MKKPSIKNILVPIDFSRMSIQGIETAKRLGRRLGARIHLAHVYQSPYPAGFMAPLPAWGELPVSLEEARRKKLGKQLQTLAQKAGLSPDDKTHLRTGGPVFDVICGLAVEISADLLVLPTHAYRGVKRFFLGSTAERLVQHSPCPILVARKSPVHLPTVNSHTGPALQVDRILVPVDFSDCSLQGLKYAIRFAEKFAAKITVLHVLDLGYSRPMDIHARNNLTRYARAAEKEGWEQMRKIVKLAHFGGVRFDTALVIGTPVEQISDFALAEDADLIITATHGLTGFKHVLIGSIAEHLVRRSRVPILVVPSHPEIRGATLTRDTRRPQSTRDQSKKRQALPVSTQRLTKRNRKLIAHLFPERRKTNKFRESHLV